MLLALISINLAILNMLPVLPLTGACALEHHRTDPWTQSSLRVFERISMIGLVIFVLLLGGDFERHRSSHPQMGRNGRGEPIADQRAVCLCGRGAPVTVQSMTTRTADVGGYPQSDPGACDYWGGDRPCRRARRCGGGGDECLRSGSSGAADRCPLRLADWRWRLCTQERLAADQSRQHRGS